MKLRNLSTDPEQRMARSSPCNACLPHLMRRGNRPVVSLIRGLRRVSSGKTSVTPNFALYPRCHEHNGAFADFWRLRLDLCIVLQNLPKVSPSPNTALRNTREIASHFSLSFPVLRTHVFSSAGASLLSLILEFWCVPSTPRGCDGQPAVSQGSFCELLHA